MMRPMTRPPSSTGFCFQHGGYTRKQLMTVGANGARAVIKQAPIITCFVRLDMTQQCGTADCCSGC